MPLTEPKSKQVLKSTTDQGSFKTIQISQKGIKEPTIDQLNSQVLQ